MYPFLRLHRSHLFGRGGATGGGYERLFDQGSYLVLNDSDPTTVIFDSIFHWNGKWLWFAFRNSGLAGQTPTYQIAKGNRYVTASTSLKLAVWATDDDTDTWNDFNNVTVGAVLIEFSNTVAFSGGTIYISTLPMYPFSRTQRMMTEWATDAYVSSPTSATNYIISNSTARDADDGSGRTAPALPFYALKITSAAANTKNTMVLISGNHPNETPGRFALEAAIDWLLAGSDLAEFLLDWFNVYVYPCVNPQGVYCGYFRSCPQDKTLDHNRQWATTGTLECIDAIKGAITTDTGGTVEVALDFHSDYETTTNIAYGTVMDNTDATHAAFATEMAALEAGYVHSNATTAGIFHKLMADDYSANLSVSFEQTGAAARTVAKYQTSGENAMKSIGYMLMDGQWTNGPGVGSRDFNGSTNRIDWANVDNLKGDPLTISAWIYTDAVAHNSYVLCQHDSGDTQIGSTANIPADTAITFTRQGTTAYIWNVTGISSLNGAWHHIVITSNGGLIDGSVAIYLDGVSKTVAFVNGTGAETEHTGSWSIGGRIYDDARNLDGKIAQVGVWNRVLTSTEIANLAAGYAPDFAAASSLLFYFKGNTSSLVATPPTGGSTGTADGTTSVTGVGNGPSIIYG